MDRWATKDFYEVETEEADRLVRPAPKVKPPRRDKRREDMDVERDPDIDDDPDVAKDPDLRMNFKDIGGRVLAAFRARADEGLVKVRHKDTGRVVQVKPDTLKSKPGEYEEIGEEEEKPSEGKPKAEPREKNDEFYQETGHGLYEAAKTDLELQTLLKGVRDPKSELGAMAGHAPNLPLAPFFKGKKPPEGLETLGDLQKAALHGRTAPKAKPAPKPAEGAPKAEGEAPAPKKRPKLDEIGDRLEKAIERLEQQSSHVPPDQQGAFDKLRKELDEVKAQLEKAVPKGEAKPTEAPPAGEAKPTEAPKPKPGEAAPAAKAEPQKDPKLEQAKKIVERFKADEGEEDPDWKSHLDAMPTTTKDANGKTVFIDPKTKKEVPFDNLPEGTKADLIAGYEKKRHGDYTSAMLASKLEKNENAKAAVEGMFDPESDLSKKIASLKAKGHDLDALPIKKNLPELADVVPANIKTVGEFQRLVESHADLFKAKTPLQSWEKDKENGPGSPAFQKYAAGVAKATTDKNGKLLFPIGKKSVPWDKLSDEQKSKLHEGFQKHETTGKWAGQFTEAARHDPDVAYALRQLGDPTSATAAKISRAADLNDPIIDQVLPALRNLALPQGATLKDVVEIAKAAFAPIPPPERPEVSKDEFATAQHGLKHAFKKYPLLGNRILELGLHPHDVTQVLATHERLRAAKLKPEELEGQIADAHKKGLYTTDPSAILPPKSGHDEKGACKSWNDLTPEEQSQSFARHRNDVIATTLALREMVNDTFRDMGVPKQFADTLALARLSRVPGESHAQRAERGKAMSAQLFNNILDSGEAHNISDKDIKRTLEAIGDDPLTRRLAVAQFQANDYQQAREQFLQKTDERDSPRNIAARIREASDFLRKAGKRYPHGMSSKNTPELYRHRVMSRLLALNPGRIEAIQPEIEKMDADDYDDAKAEYQSAVKKWSKELKSYEKAVEQARKEVQADFKKNPRGYPYREQEIEHIAKTRLDEAGTHEPVPPDDLPPRPPGYDLVRKTPQGKAQSGKSLWNRLFRGLPGRTASERVVDRFLYSSCAPGEAMGTDKTAVYWGVDPNDAASKAKAVNVPHRPWEQAHARDLDVKDYNAILAAAREWMKVPVLARILDEKDSLGAVRDIQLRAALDLALRDMEGGKYSVGLYPTVYNNLLAQLGGKSETDTLLTVRQASGSLYTKTQGEDCPMKAAAEIRKFAAEIAGKEPGLAFDLTNLAFRVAEQEKEQEQGKEQKEDKKPDFLKDKEAARYAAVRGAIIRVAHDNPAIRPALTPVLQLLKQQG